MNAMLEAGLPKASIHLHSHENTVNANSVDWKPRATKAVLESSPVEELAPSTESCTSFCLCGNNYILMIMSIYITWLYIYIYICMCIHIRHTYTNRRA